MGVRKIFACRQRLQSGKNEFKVVLTKLKDVVYY